MKVFLLLVLYFSLVLPAKSSVPFDFIMAHVREYCYKLELRAPFAETEVCFIMERHKNSRKISKITVSTLGMNIDIPEKFYSDLKMPSPDTFYASIPLKALDSDGTISSFYFTFGYDIPQKITYPDGYSYHAEKIMRVIIDDTGQVTVEYEDPADYVQF